MCDFSFVDDYAFALLTLSNDEMKIYDQIFAYIQEKIEKPQALIRLSAPVEILLSRINERGRVNEQGIDAAYLSGFTAALNRAVEIIGNGVRIIDMNTDKTSLREYNNNLYESWGIL